VTSLAPFFQLFKFLIYFLKLKIFEFEFELHLEKGLKKLVHGFAAKYSKSVEESIFIDYSLNPLFCQKHYFVLSAGFYWLYAARKLKTKIDPYTPSP
jgi:hypothetical protein